ncbi:MAG: alpha/beta hydrolase fold domain-containing protein [Treponema sp.]|nr:alpha/beta hydrolase fold domain-containing protein [Candidatus Treponema caballi]
MTNDRRSAVKKLKTLVYTPKSETESFRRRIEDSFTNVFLPNHVEKTEIDAEGIVSDMLTPQVYATDRIILYIHGGSFVGGSRASWRNFCASLANTSNTRVVVPEFRLAPKYAYPAALDDAKKVLKYLYQDGVQITIAADGSGASIALALVFCLKGEARKKIDNIVLLSPWLNLSGSASILHMKKCRDEILSPEAVRHCSNMYTYESNQVNPLVSPLCAQPQMFEDFPEVYIQMGEKEALKEDAEKFCALLKEADVPHILDVWPDMMFMFQMADEYIKEAHLAVIKLGKYVQDFKQRKRKESEEQDIQDNQESI